MLPKCNSNIINIFKKALLLVRCKGQNQNTSPTVETKPYTVGMGNISKLKRQQTGKLKVEHTDLCKVVQVSSPWPEAWSLCFCSVCLSEICASPCQMEQALLTEKFSFSEHYWLASLTTLLNLYLNSVSWTLSMSLSTLECSSYNCLNNAVKKFFFCLLL